MTEYTIDFDKDKKKRRQECADFLSDILLFGAKYKAYGSFEKEAYLRGTVHFCLRELKIPLQKAFRRKDT